VQEAEPTAGQVTVYFVRDNEVDILPSAAEVQEVKDKLLEIKPAHTSDDDVIVSAPTGVVIDFTISNLLPATTTMQEAITANLTQLFAEGTDVGVDLLQIAYTSVIYQTVDTTTGDTVASFTVNNPIGDVTIASNELPILGTVSFT
jgi:uncharacterized phage protein gp47/JayE